MKKTKDMARRDFFQLQEVVVKFRNGRKCYDHNPMCLSRVLVITMVNSFLDFTSHGDIFQIYLQLPKKL